MRVALCVVFVAFLALVSAKNFIRDPTNDMWSNCGNTTDHFHIKNVVLTPDPPVRGQNFTISASGSLDEALTAGKAELVVKYMGIKLLDQTKDVCQLSPDISCPIPAGDYTHTQTVPIPSVTPPGHYTGQLTVTDQNGAEVACVAFDFIMKSA